MREVAGRKERTRTCAQRRRGRLTTTTYYYNITRPVEITGIEYTNTAYYYYIWNSICSSIQPGHYIVRSSHTRTAGGDGPSSLRYPCKRTIMHDDWWPHVCMHAVFTAAAVHSVMLTPAESRAHHPAASSDAPRQPACIS